MSWNSVFSNVENILKLITLIGPLIDWIELLFKRFYPKQKAGILKRLTAISIAKKTLPESVTEDEIGSLIDAYVKNKNDREDINYTHSV